MVEVGGGGRGEGGGGGVIEDEGTPASASSNAVFVSRPQELNNSSLLRRLGGRGRGRGRGRGEGGGGGVIEDEGTPASASSNAVSVSRPQLNNSSLLRRLGGRGRGRGEGGGGRVIEDEGTTASASSNAVFMPRLLESNFSLSHDNLTKGEIQRIIKLKNKKIKSPGFIATNLNRASKDTTVLMKIINGWGDNINRILQNVIDKEYNDKSLSISLIFNALSKIEDKSKIEDNGKKVKEFFEIINDSNKWQNILDNANAQAIALIFNALSKIKDNGKKVGEFYDKIAPDKWPNIIDNAKFQEISNIFNALSKIEDKSKIEDNGKKVKEFFEIINPNKWPNILENASAQGIALILNALSKIEDNGKKVEKFYDKISTDKWPNIIDNAKFQEISNIFNALSKIKDDGKKVEELYKKINETNSWEKKLKANDVKPNNICNILCALSKVKDDGKLACEFYNKIGADLLIKGANVRDLVVNIDVLAKTTQGKHKLKEIYEKIPPKLLKKMIEDTNLDNIRGILVSLSKSPEAGKFLGDLCKHNSWKSKTFDRSDRKLDFANVTKIIEALNSVEGNGVLLIRDFYNSTKNNYVKTGKELACKYNKQDIENQDFLLDLHRLGINEAKIVTKLFLEDMKKESKEKFYIECGRGIHTKPELLGIMAKEEDMEDENKEKFYIENEPEPSGKIAKEVEKLLEELKDITCERVYGLIKVEKKKELGTPPTTVGVGVNDLRRRGVSAPAASS
ncbi:hypothetical protein LBMAG18_12540 [Alphaproteobacteria bacterium]|nr:hypothetical protein LBMAG18_12540 [Alphaproteobacteria bacterium]